MHVTVAEYTEHAFIYMHIHMHTGALKGCGALQLALLKCGLCGVPCFEWLFRDHVDKQRSGRNASEELIHVAFSKR